MMKVCWCWCGSLRGVAWPTLLGNSPRMRDRGTGGGILIIRVPGRHTCTCRIPRRRGRELEVCTRTDRRTGQSEAISSGRETCNADVVQRR
ncbi:hypothetical protein GGS24DRAFT_333628 [Hypoxylon argillaceum]|nr:hypothetical protein GGS24DRAFT_333628 [Hypoxylon argillaceum]